LIDDETANAVLAYLSQKSYCEVFQLIQRIQALRPAPTAPPVEPPTNADNQ
jgi:hypothetical protein